MRRVEKQGALDLDGGSRKLDEQTASPPQSFPRPGSGTPKSRPRRRACRGYERALEPQHWTRLELKGLIVLEEELLQVPVKVRSPGTVHALINRQIHMSGEPGASAPGSRVATTNHQLIETYI
jgi:hypothetical protein